MLSGALNGLISAMIALLIGIAFGVTLAMGIMAIAYIFVVTMLIGLGFGALSMVVASKVRKVDAYTIFAQAVGLPLWFISGGITPISSLPSWLAAFSAIDPLTYATDISRAVIMQGFISTSQLITDMGILALFVVIMALLAFKTFKPTIE
jgi:ABC-2 type transport system permease protein